MDLMYEKYAMGIKENVFLNSRYCHLEINIKELREKRLKKFIRRVSSPIVVIPEEVPLHCAPDLLSPESQTQVWGLLSLSTRGKEKMPPLSEA